MPPPGFSWVDRPHLAALARPQSVEDLHWLRRNGIDVLVSLTESPVPRAWVNDAGFLAVNVPVPDMEPPTDRQLDHLINTIRKANASGMGWLFIARRGWAVPARYWPRTSSPAGSRHARRS